MMGNLCTTEGIVLGLWNGEEVGWLMKELYTMIEVKGKIILRA
jgi:hypothetical protein